MNASGLRSVVIDVTQMQAVSYRLPPWSYSEEEIAGYSTELERHLELPGFRATTAREGGRLVGVAYGFPGPERIPDGAAFYGPVVAALGRARADELLSGHPFEVVQVMVEPASQRQGIGRALLERLIADMGRAWLVTLPESPASRLYRSAGWQPLQPHLSLWGRELEVWVRGL